MYTEPAVQCDVVGRAQKIGTGTDCPIIFHAVGALGAWLLYKTEIKPIFLGSLGAVGASTRTLQHTLILPKSLNLIVVSLLLLFLGYIYFKRFLYLAACVSRLFCLLVLFLPSVTSFYFLFFFFPG